MNIRILAVDDNEDNRCMLDALLKSARYESDTASHGREALEKLRKERFDMVITDILMPVMDGFQLCRECRGDAKLKDLSFIFYTATYTDDKDEKLALALGADKYIRKPIEPDKLLRIVAAAVEHRRARARARSADSDADNEVLSLYNQRLVEKLENKMEDLKRSQARYLNLWESVTDLVFALDEDNRVLDINHCRDMLGYDPTDVIGRDFTDFLSTESSGDAARCFRRPGTKKDKSSDTCEVAIVRKDGSRIVAELNLSTIYDGNKFVGKYGIARDISERKRIERELRESAHTLRAQADALEQKNAALRELLAQIETEKKEMKRRIGLNVQRLILPALRQLKAGGDSRDALRFQTIEKSIGDLTTKFGANIGMAELGLSPRQIGICNMIRSGMSSKDIAAGLGISIRTVETHRNAIRKKLGLPSKEARLSTYLKSLEE